MLITITLGWAFVVSLLLSIGRLLNNEWAWHIGLMLFGGLISFLGILAGVF